MRYDPIQAPQLGRPFVDAWGSGFHVLVGDGCGQRIRHDGKGLSDGIAASALDANEAAAATAAPAAKALVINWRRSI